jgi:rubrerythrin
MNPTTLKYLKLGLEIEKKGIRFYKNTYKQAMDPNSKKLLKFLIGEEEIHVKMFDELIKEAGKPLPNISQDIPIFNKEDYKKVKKSPHTIKVFFTALEMEERSIKLYQEAASKTKEKPLKKLLTDLVKWEQEHFKLIKSHQESLYNEWYWDAMGQPRFQT